MSLIIRYYPHLSAINPYKWGNPSGHLDLWRLSIMTHPPAVTPPGKFNTPFLLVLVYLHPNFYFFVASKQKTVSPCFNASFLAHSNPNVASDAILILESLFLFLLVRLICSQFIAQDRFAIPSAWSYIPPLYSHLK